MLLQGRGLKLLSLLLAAAALAGAAAVAATGSFALPPSGEAACSPGDAARAAEALARARAAESRGDVAGAVGAYRAAAAADPGLIDRKDPRWLGDGFERRLSAWIAGMKEGRIPGGPAALADASYLFRKIYGGCG
jgi:hypothetical protein